MRHAVALAAQAMPLVLVGAAVAGLGALGGVLFGERAPGLELLAEAVGLALAGRGVLALLPPGGPFGRHGALSTWAISYWLGALLAKGLGPELTASEVLWVPLLWLPLVLAAGVSALGALPLRPRHVHTPLRRNAWDTLGSWVFGVAAAALALGAELPVAAVAFVVLVRAALECADVPARRAGFTAAGLAGVFWMLDSPPFDPGSRWPLEVLVFALGAVVWLRRADRRGVWIASLALVDLAAKNAAVVALAAAIALWFATARPARGRLSAPFGVAVATCAALAFRADLPWFSVPVEELFADNSYVWRSILLGLLVLPLLDARRTPRGIATESPVRDGDPPRAERWPPGKERWALGALALTCIAAAPTQSALLAVALTLAVAQRR